MAADWKVKEHDFLKTSPPFLVRMQIKLMYYLKDMKEHCNYSIWYKFVNSCILKTIGINVEKIIQFNKKFDLGSQKYIKSTIFFRHGITYVIVKTIIPHFNLF